MAESPRRVKDFPHYTVSEDGKIYNLRRGRYITPSALGQIILCDGPRCRRVTYTHLIAETWIGPRPSNTARVVFKDGNKEVLHWSNLAWLAAGAKLCPMCGKGWKKLYGGLCAACDQEYRQLGQPISKTDSE